MKLVRHIAAMGIVPCLLLLTLALSSCTSSPEGKSARFMEAGKKLLDRKDPARAILEFQNAIRATPKNSDAYYQLGTAYLATGDLRGGVVELRKALELNPKHTAAQLRLAELMTEASEKEFWRDAEQRLHALLQDDPANARALHALALTELKLGEPSDAVANLERALQAAPTELMIAVTLARAKLQGKDSKSAEEVLRKAGESLPKSADAAVLLGQFYAAQNRVIDAEGQYEAALKLDPNHGPALLDLALLQMATGRKPAAEENFKRLTSLPDKQFHSYYGTFLFQENRRDEAVRELVRLAKQDPEDRVARTRLVVAYRSLNQEANAANVLEQALKKNPSDLDALLQRAEMSLAARNYSQAESDLNKVISFTPSAAEPRYISAKLHEARGSVLSYRADLFKAIELNPYLLTVRLELAESLIGAKDGKGALSLLAGAPESQRQLTPMVVERNWALWTAGDMGEMRKGIDFGLARQRSADFLLQDGLWKLRSGNISGARTALEEALKTEPSNVRALRTLNASYGIQKQDATALRIVKEYASRQPRSAPVQEFLGMLLMINGDRQQARTAFEAALAVDPKLVNGNLSLVQLDIADGKLDSAQQRLAAVLASDKSNVIARLWLGNLNAMRRDNKAAIEQYRQVIEGDPSNAQALNNLAYMLTDFDNQLNDALKYAQKAKELVPDNAGYSDTLGWILYRKGLYSSAVAELERATAKGGEATWKYHLAMAYAMASDPTHGRAILQAALKQNPNLPEAKMAREMLETRR